MAAASPFKRSSVKQKLMIYSGELVIEMVNLGFLTGLSSKRERRFFSLFICCLNFRQK